jgi:hypothetical protein
MIGPGEIEVGLQRRRLAMMLGTNLVCLIIAAAAAVGVLVFHVGALAYLFVAALLTGFAAHVWLMLGLARKAGPKGSV